MRRIEKLTGYLEKCTVFTDVACDHGYCAEYMLKTGLCESAVISDISPQSLSKAEKLLSGYIKCGKCRSVCCDGLEKIEKNDGLVLIAGIGGEETVKILKNSYIPERFVFQPMKNSSYLRDFLISKGCNLEKDDVFFDGKKYYFVIKGTSGGACRNYSVLEKAFGKDSLKNPEFIGYATEELAKKRAIFKRKLSSESRKKVTQDVEFLERAIDETRRNIE